ncbi:MAG TPA: sigma 54-interacting transcriptional regulator [Polyangia bacterium]|nr:sigma 54-interacting transcriptional regulator [Polyangia bacterium]
MSRIAWRGTVRYAKAQVNTRSTIVEDPDFIPEDREGQHVLVMSPDSFNTYPLPKLGVVTIGRSGKSEIIVDDPMASREHARLHIGDAHGVYVEDTGSANGTRVRDSEIEAGKKVLVAPGEAISIGNTVLMVQQNRTTVVHQRLWSHAYFETRLDAECARGDTSGGHFTLVRLRVEQTLPWTKLAPILAQHVPAPNVFAAYGPDDYEILLIEKGAAETTALIEQLRVSLAEIDVVARAGVASYPRDGRTVDTLLARANARLRPAATSEAGRSVTPASGQGPVMRKLYELAARAAGSMINVLVLGETGVGKEVMAKTLHSVSPRADKPFMAVNCAGLPENLIESELFGHERGAFTGAVVAKQGLLELAEGGTVFLDEVGELPLQVQAKLLRIIETREVTRVGALKAKRIDVRFVSATNRILEQEVIQGTFRRDLFFRLNGITLAIPPLRDRASEIETLARQFVAIVCNDVGRPPAALSAGVVELLNAYSWPGNIRELKNVVERALVLCDGDEILPEHLPLEKMVPGRIVEEPPVVRQDEPAPPATLSTSERDERRRMVEALAARGGNQTQAAADMGMPRRTFVSKLDRYQIKRPQKRQLSP